MQFEHGVYGVLVVLEQELEIGRQLGNVVFVLLSVNSDTRDGLPTICCRYCHQRGALCRTDTHNPLLSPLTSNIPGPPVLALLGHVCAVHARLPTVLPGLALSAESHRNDLVAETDTDDPYVLRLR